MHEMPMRRTARSMRSARPLDADDARLLAGRVRGAATAGVAHLAPLWQTPVPSQIAGTPQDKMCQGRTPLRDYNVRFSSVSDRSGGNVGGLTHLRACVRAILST